MDWSQLSALSPSLVLMFGALAVVLLDLVLPRDERHALPLAALAAVGAAAAALAQGWAQSAGDGRLFAPGRQILSGAFVLDGLGAWTCVAILIGTTLTLIAGLGSPLHSARPGEYHGLVLLAASGMMLLSQSADLLVLLVSLEMMSVATYALCGSHRADPRSGEAAIKYFVMGSFGTAFLLFGMAFFYGATGSLALSARLVPAAPEGLLAAGIGLMLVGFLFKVGAAPFHQWVPDVYEGAPTPIAGFMAAGVKAAAFAVLARAVLTACPSAADASEMWSSILWGASLLTIVLGNVIALAQSSVKRMLAYSSIAHTGYLLIALMRLPQGLDALDRPLAGMLYYLIAYGVVVLGAFGVISLTRGRGRELETYDDFVGLAEEKPAAALCMTVFMLSLAGFPPLAGFFAKFLVFKEAVARGEVLLVVVGVLASVVSLGYYLRVVVCMYMTSRRPQPAALPEESPVQMPGGGLAEAGEPSRPAAKEPAPVEWSWASSLAVVVPALAAVALGLIPGALGGLSARM